MLMRMVHEGMRAGDGDRETVAEQLKQALDQGRLDLSEYDERVQKAYAAKTYGDLEGLLADLPGTVPVEKAQVEPHRNAVAPEPENRRRPGRSAFPGMLGVFLVCVVVWAMSSLGSGEWHYFWPGWVLIPVVWALVAHFRDRGNRGH
ncbi:DUF1707 domain-containing protein [Actinoplanes sichuanensis]|uniref:DUF1707 domain-containing protein n=1 Tax=Actinoplanes sichuanensis TaxID=512349 RepID=A0ABW4ADQ9_9ACTN|nr:DUF1707 domain-containing protein [Actinoplanes sichuanensis]BEL09982.1 DUF1707 domain-containing protein [Actinoplanes sichuanensis]